MALSKFAKEAVIFVIEFYKTVNGVVEKIEKLEKGCWINVFSPSEKEISCLINEFGLDSGFLYSSLDEEESSRIEVEDNQTLIIVDTPVADYEDTSESVSFYTIPLGIIIKNDFVITVSIKQNNVLTEFIKNNVKNVKTSLKTQFVLMILLKIASTFLHNLKQIEKISGTMESQMYKSMKNKGLIQLLGLEKSLVYFSVSLKANEVTLNKILRGKVINFYEEDQDLLEDVLVEIKQGVEMSTIYSSILHTMMDAYGSIISNNVNTVMKRLTIITIIIAIPNIVFSFYGMNVEKLPFANSWFALSLGTFITLVISLLLFRKNK